MGVPSRDGRSIPYVDEHGNLQNWMVATGRSIKILDLGDPRAVTGVPVLSAGGDQVVYGWLMPDGAAELRAVNTDGTWPRVIVSRTTAYKLMPVDWSRDGREVLCWFARSDARADLVLVPASGGAPRVIDSFAKLPVLASTGEPDEPSLSPDGRLVVYFRPKEPGNDGRALFMAATDGSQRYKIAAATSDDSRPMWTPDGGSVVFFRTDKETDVFRLRIVNGAAPGPAELIARKVGPPLQASVSDDGALYSSISYTIADVYTISVDVSGRMPPGPQTRLIDSEITGHILPSWSPDGQSIAYVHQTHEELGRVPGRTLMVKDVASGRFRSLGAHLTSVDGYPITWTRDGRSIVAWGRDTPADDRAGCYRIEFDSDLTTPIAVGANLEAARSVCWPDGQMLFRVDRGDNIVVRDLRTSAESVVAAGGKSVHVGPPLLDPGGPTLAWVRTAGVEEDGSWSSATIEVQALGGAARQLFATTYPEQMRLQAWTQDRSALLFTRGTGREGSNELWLLPLDGHQPARDLQLKINGNRISRMSLASDGRHVAYTEVDDVLELWIRPGLFAR
jgi:Tol biopolymer transport system component